MAKRILATPDERAAIIAEAEIYALCDPENGKVRYIGKADNSVRRIQRHMRDMKRRDYPLYRWMKKLASKGLSPKLEILMLSKDWCADERRLIAESRARGDSLLNVADGGDMPTCSPEQRSANGRALNVHLRANPMLARMREIKVRLLGSIRRGGVSNFVRIGLRAAAQENPGMLGCFANIGFAPQEGTHARRN